MVELVYNELEGENKNNIYQEGVKLLAQTLKFFLCLSKFDYALNSRRVESDYSTVGRLIRTYNLFFLLCKLDFLSC